MKWNEEEEEEIHVQISFFFFQNCNIENHNYYINSNNSKHANKYTFIAHELINSIIWFNWKNRTSKKKKKI